ncbi:hypothetical protein F542_1070 [Bibersteinia trehalosi USDA-ARS-USMARC-188]|uniref:Uncharacterized protein n=3 Tax=Bibersteinia trehalosi TaxID=47735 RepID=W0R9G5_BIBTR|nr:hypothetical protein WQG_21530 [Bibersteinia trehalosi USDA-ARS-USMARC-192]AHG80824.1 hypothetical protein F542_1070 [Bibersteinia trehalosi USDA-ARS-USMARC-188]AHG82973.1 hypothetical protein F543_1100 [Bibersteinia trehalosi USDA-ARS-USMARC-189]AHG87436.1 hypothetical protein F544_22070 [Bibersteinia trehalosi USDA-ARS-USMARC-190]
MDQAVSYKRCKFKKILQILALIAQKQTAEFANFFANSAAYLVTL